jgi:hypothetical protein
MKTFKQLREDAVANVTTGIAGLPPDSPPVGKSKILRRKQLVPMLAKFRKK